MLLHWGITKETERQGLLRSAREGIMNPRGEVLWGDIVAGACCLAFLLRILSTLVLLHMT